MRKSVFTTVLLLIAATMVLLVLCVKIHSADKSDTETPINEESVTRSTTDADTSMSTVSIVPEPEKCIITDDVPLPFDLPLLQKVPQKCGVEIVNAKVHNSSTSLCLSDA